MLLHAILSCWYSESVSLSTWEISNNIIHVASLLIVQHTYTQDRGLHIPFLLNISSCCNNLCLIRLEQCNLKLVIWTISILVSSIYGFKSLPLMIIQWFDPPHNMTSHTSISSSAQCIYSLLKLRYSTSDTKLSLTLHLCLVCQSPFLDTFTLASHPQVT